MDKMYSVLVNSVRLCFCFTDYVLVITAMVTGNTAVLVTVVSTQANCGAELEEVPVSYDLCFIMLVL